MKKIVSVMMSFVLLFSLCSCERIGSFFEKKTMKDIAEERLNLSLKDAIILEEWDTHGGFHGDGDAFVKLSCADGFGDRLGAEWQALPLEGAAYQYFYEWGGVFQHPESGEKVIPEVENGYWYFQDTGPMNWDFALFDCEKNILYFYEFDS